MIWRLIQRFLLSRQQTQRTFFMTTVTVTLNTGHEIEFDVLPSLDQDLQIQASARYVASRIMETLEVLIDQDSGEIAQVDRQFVQNWQIQDREVTASYTRIMLLGIPVTQWQRQYITETTA